MRLQFRGQALGIVLVCLLAVAGNGAAAAFVVSSSEDSGLGTFREAVASANASLGPDKGGTYESDDPYEIWPAAEGDETCRNHQAHSERR
jgi:hypothetical protein